MKLKYFFIIIVLLGLIPIPVFADYNVNGIFMYEDRPQNYQGFTGEIVNKPIRGADVEVIDAGKNPVVVLAKGSTDNNGYFSIQVQDNVARTIAIRALTSSEMNPELFRQKVIAFTGDALYSVISQNYENHEPNSNIDFTSTPIIADKDGAGPAFHLFDLGESAENYVQELTEALPRKPMKVYWERGHNDYKMTYSDCSAILLKGGPAPNDDDAYDDSVALHEMGHYIALCYSKDAQYYAKHSLAWLIDIRMAYTEGLGSYFMGAIRNYLGDPNGMLYIETNGAQLKRYGMAKANDRDTPAVYSDGDFTKSAANEAAVAHTLYDIIDGKDSNDGTPGVDDDDIDLPDMEADRLVWNILTKIDSDYNLLTKKITYESFWDLWLATNPYTDELSNIQRQVGIMYVKDEYENNDDRSAATNLDLSTGIQKESMPTYYPAGDKDYWFFESNPDYNYAFETTNLYDGADPILSLYDADGTLIESNDNMNPLTKSSRIAFKTEIDGRYFLQSERFRESPSPIGEYGYFTLAATPILIPRVDSITPQEGNVIGGISVTIRGKNFKAGAKVFFGVYEAPSVSVISDDTIVAVTPANIPGLSEIKVVNPGGDLAESKQARLFTYTGDALAPEIISLSLDGGSKKAGTEVEINGNYFMYGAQVFFGDIPADATFINPTLIKAKVPSDDLQLVFIKVINPDGKEAISQKKFEITKWYSENFPVVGYDVGTIVRAIYVEEDFTVANLHVLLDISKIGFQNMLRATLTAPSGKTVLVYDGAYEYDEDGTWRDHIKSMFGIDEPPAEMLNSFEGENAKGLWTLTITHGYNWDTEWDRETTLNSWGIEFFRFMKKSFSSILLAAAQDRNFIIAVDPVTHEQLYKVKLNSSFPNDVAIDENNLVAYGLSRRDDSKITKFDLKTGRILDYLYIPSVDGFNSPHVMELTPDSKSLVVSTTEALYIIDTQTKRTTTLLDYEIANSFTMSIAISPDGKKVYLVAGVTTGDRPLWIVDLETKQLLKKVDVQGNPTSVAVSPDGSKIYLLDNKFDSGFLTIMDAQTYNVEDIIPASSSTVTYIRVTNYGNKVYATRYQFYEDFTAFDLINKVSKKVEFSSNTDMTSTGLDIAEDTGLVYIADWYNGDIYVIDPVTDNRVDKINLNFKESYWKPLRIEPMGIDYFAFPQFCSDAIVNGDEQCDDGNTISGDGCNIECEIEVCGDNAVNNKGNEECDDGNTIDGDGCNAACIIEYCGDGIANNDEDCDLGLMNGELCSPPYGTSCTSCDNGCRIITENGQFCGDNTINGNEQCDDTICVSEDPTLVGSCNGCSCVFVNPEICGDGNIDDEEDCDDANTLDNDGCNSVCQTEFCGDNVIQLNEECDAQGMCEPAYESSCTYCNACNIEVRNGPYCGDSIINGPEECDDSNTIDGDGCNAACITEYCGDAFINGNDECESANDCYDANQFTVDDCIECSCSYFDPQVCSDGNVDAGEQCDDGNTISGDGCNIECEIEVCGDNAVNNNGNEECDDGYELNREQCTPLYGGECTYCNRNCENVQIQGPYCGDAILNGDEQCDDANNDNNDACKNDCSLNICGDNYINYGAESCERENTVNNENCKQSIFECLGTKTKSRDYYGNCTNQCQCSHDQFDQAICVQGSCNAGCDDNNDCNDNNVATIDTCNLNTCGCENINPVICGDGNIDMGEQCDDGNLINKDGCNYLCQLEKKAANLTQIANYFCTFTHGGYGAPCKGDNAGCLRDKYFSTVFPSGLGIGEGVLCDNNNCGINAIQNGAPYYSTIWKTSSAFVNFITSGGTPSKLTKDAKNPNSTSAGVFAAQLTAATLSVRLDQSGLVFDGQNPKYVKYDKSKSIENVVFTGKSGCDGLKVYQVITESNKLISGQKSAFSYPALTNCLTLFNKAFDGCKFTDPTHFIIPKS